MGNVTSSAPTKQLTPKQRDIKHLGDRMPFGDAELFQVYNAYHDRLKKGSDKVSFLTDIGVLSSPGLSDEERDKLYVLLQAVEMKILPPNFGNTLYRTCFLRPTDVSEYTNTGGSKAGDENVSTNEDDYTRMAKLEAFFEGLSNCTRRGTKNTLKALMACCEQHPAPISDSATNDAFAYPATTTRAESKSLINPFELVNIGYRVALASSFLTSTEHNNDDHQDLSRFLPDDNASDHPGLIALANSLVDLATKRQQRNQRSNTPSTEKKQLVDEHDVLEWAEQVAPLFASSMATFMHTIFFPNRPYPPSRTSFEYPDLSGFDSEFFRKENSPLLFSFGCMSMSLNGEFYRLYTSASDGLSFNRLQNALVGYGGPTLIMIESDGCVFGAFTASTWKESKDFYGNSDCFLYQLLPTTALYRPSGDGSNYMYCNSHARSRGYDQQAHGIGFGGTVHQPRLFLSECFDKCRAMSQDMSFEKGPLLNSKSPTFQIDSLEVWGCGGTEVVQEALGARSRQRDIKNAAIQKARKVDKAAFLDDFKSGLIESKNFAHRAQIQGRDGSCISDEDLK